MCLSRHPRSLLSFLTSLFVLLCLQTPQALADDTTPPTTPAVTDDGQYTTSTTELHAVCSSNDPETGIQEYRYQVRQQSATGAIVRAWTSASSACSIVATGFQCGTGKSKVSGLCNGQTYVFEVQARNGANVWSASGFSDGIKVDFTPPSVPIVSDDGSVMTSTSQFHFQWTPSTDAQSGIASYKYWLLVGLSAPGSAIRWGMIPGTASDFTVTNLSLQLGNRYWVRLEAKNGAGLTSELSTSDGIDVLSSTEIQLTAESRGYPAEEWPYQGGVARFSRFSTVFSQGWGGGNGGRGFNVVTIYPTTGEIGPWQGHFDTFISPSEPAKTALVDLLNSIPDGMIVMIAVADEAGLTQYSPSSCTPKTDAATESVRTTLEALGSTQIRNYCFQGSWAMISVKGEGVARGEQLLNVFPPGPGPAIVTVSIPLGGGDPTPPTAPSQPTEGQPDIDATNVGSWTVYWTAASDPESGIDCYELEERVGTSVSSGWSPVGGCEPGTSRAIDGRTANLPHHYQVRARNGAGLLGSYSTISDGILLDTTTPIVSAIGVTSIASSGASLNWSTNEQTFCTVSCGTSPSPTTSCATTPLNLLHATALTGLTANTTYYVKTICQDSASNSGMSSTSFVTQVMTVPNAPSLVTPSGRQLLLQRRNPDGTLAPAVPYIIRGINWSPASQNTNTTADDANNATIRRPEFGNWYLTDIPLIKAMNVNTVRLFIDPGIPTDTNITIPGRQILDEFYRNDIMVILTVDDASNKTARIPAVVQHYKDHPAVLAWSLGSEWNINQYFTCPLMCMGIDTAAQRTEEAAQLVKNYDTMHPVISSYGNMAQYPNKLQTHVDETCPSVDIWSFNEYRGPGMGRFFEQWRMMSDKPMFLGEYGIDAYDSTPPGGENQVVHAQWVTGLWDDIARNLSAVNPMLTGLGGFVFEWNDEWWKAYPPGQQDTNGWNPAGFPDGAASEDWWGIVDIDRTPRQLYSSLTTAFHPGYVPPTVSARTFKAVSIGATAEPEDAAEFWENGALFYRAIGHTNDGGRGFNIVAIDPSNGVLLNQKRPGHTNTFNYDTWATRGTGTEMTAMADFLNGLPNGTIVLAAVGDEAGLTLSHLNPCTRFAGAWIEAGLQALESLGSTKIRNYCYWDSWAMIAVKGEGVARAEQLGSGVPVAAEATLSFP